MAELQGILERNNVKCAKLGYGRVWRLRAGDEKGRQNKRFRPSFGKIVKSVPKSTPKNHLISRKIGTE